MKLTQAGRTALWNARNTGVQAELTHIQVGIGRKLMTGEEEELLFAVQTSTIASGSRPAPDQIRVSSLFPGTSSFDFTEVGIFIGNPEDGGVLFAYYSVMSGKVGTMVAGTDYVFAHEWKMAEADAGAIVVLVDGGQSTSLGMIAEHQAGTDPHPVYAKKAGIYPNMTVGNAESAARVGNTPAGDVWTDSRAMFVKNSTAGHRVAPDGYIEQWGYVVTNTNSAGGLLISLPKPFPAAMLNSSAVSANGTNPPTVVGIGPGGTPSIIDIRFSANTKGLFYKATGY